MPTTRQIIAVKKLAEILRNTKNQKNITIGKILRDAGYSQYQSEAPSQVTGSKGFRSLLDKYLPEELVHQTHSELLQAARLDDYKMDATLTDEQIEKIVEAVPGCKVRKILRIKGSPTVTVYFWTPDGQTRKSAVEMAYKLRGSFAPEKHEESGEITVRTISYKDEGSSLPR